MRRYRIVEDLLPSVSDLIRVGLPIALLISTSALAFAAPARRVIRLGWRALARCGKRPMLSLVILSMLAGLLFAIPWMLGHVQPANVHDEFSYLLAADTFRHGRLTNPSPPLWQAFQTMHVLVSPTYMSKFPPVQGLVLAAGWMLGSPRVGAIGAGALACAAVAWMLRARMSWRWALVGGLLAALMPATYEWTQSFWGGSVAMLGGAMFCGAMLRVDRLLVGGARVDKSALKIGVIAGAGLSILANSRPFEGLLFAIILGLILVTRLLIHRARPRAAFAPLLGGAAIVLAPVAIWVGYYNFRITGHALQMPYALHAAQYMVAPVFWWQSLQNPKTDILHIAAFHEQFEFREYDQQCSAAGFFRGVWRKLTFVRWTLFYPLIYFPVLIGGGLALWRWRSARLALAVPIVLLVAHMLCTPWLRSHYLAPVIPLWIMFVVYSIRAIGEVRLPGFKMKLPRTLAPAIACGLLLSSATFALHTNILAAIQREEAGNAREDVLAATRRIPGAHIIFVYYGDGPQDRYEWVTNPAEITAAPVLFVHMRTPDLDMALVNAFPERSVWMLTVNNDKFELRPVVLRNEPDPKLAPP
ncbi:hypothetical protein BH09PLA1_BH09PLA1_06270 [soil metagenome]